MKIFRNYINRSLLKNPMRTAVTVIGILLSAAMFTAVTVSLSSFLDYLKRLAIEECGSYHILYASEDDGREVLENRKDVVKTATLSHIGFAKIGSRNEEKPYLALEGMSENFTDLVTVHLLSGRMPEKEGEILLPAHLRTNGGVKTQLGDTLRLSFGVREYEGVSLGLESSFRQGESFRETGDTRSYTVVGYYQRFHYAIERYTCPGYLALTVGESGGREANTITFVQAKSIYRTGSLQTAIVQAPSTDRMELNNDLYRGSGLFRADMTGELVLLFIPFLMLLILFGSVALIYNSFSITLSERTRQMGILHSIGATKKQLRRSVRYEAFVLCLVGVPLGILSGILGMGVTFFFLRDTTSSLLGNGLYIRLAVSPVAVLSAFLVTVLTVFLSASIPARRVLRASAIEAIRQTSDVKMPKRTGKGRLWKRLFHLEGELAYKNSCRFKKRYRTTVFSLVVSIVLFVAACAFSNYLTASAFSASTITPYDLVCYAYGSADVGSGEEVAENYEKIYRDLSALPETEDCAFVNYGTLELSLENAPLKKDAVNYIGDDLSSVDCEKVRIDLPHYLELLDSLGIERPQPGEDYPLLLLDRQVEQIEREDGSRDSVVYSCFEKDAFPCTITAKTERILWNGEFYLYDGYAEIPQEAGENGEVEEFLRFLPEGKEEKDCSSGEILYLTEEEYEEAREVLSLPITASSAEIPWYLRSFGNGFFLVEAISQDAPFVIPFRGRRPEFFFRAKDPAALEKAMAAYSETESPIALSIYNAAESEESERALLTVIKVFAYGFIALISLISVANVFNTISTGVILRRREFAMLRSIGMTNRGIAKMMCCESLLFGVRGLGFGLPGAMLFCSLLRHYLHKQFHEGFPLPWGAALIATVCVFLVVFASMYYATGKIRKDEPLDTLRNENI